MILRSWIYLLLGFFFWVGHGNLYAEDSLPSDFTQVEESHSLGSLIAGTEVVLQGLDKITGRVFTLRTPLGKIINFGRLQVMVKRCYKTSPEEVPESIAEVDIFEYPPETKENVLVFRGLMYASSPSVSALDHPVYDVWIKECI